MERVIRILLVLAERAGRGATAHELREIAGWPDTENGLTQLRRDLKQLRGEGGWQIESIGEEGTEGRYVLFADDNRLALTLSAGERAALQQAAATVTEVADPPAGLATLEHAIESRCRVRFSYKQKDRELHPHSLHNGPSGWMLRAREVDSTLVKAFVVARISGPVTLDDPGSAQVPDELPRRSFDPLTWPVDPPETVLIATSPEFAAEALDMLTGSSERERTEQEVIIAVPVTHRSAFRSRMAELGVRARFVGTSANADEMIMMLLQRAGRAG